MAAFAAQTLSASSNSGPLNVVRIVDGQTQVVAGINYLLTLELSGSESKTCTVKVFDQPWTNTRKLLEASCA